jgi:hypothetical protein
MFCPSCRDEFRAGFTRCATCDVELVEDLSAASAVRAAAVVPPPSPLRLIDYCGFFLLDEAREARDKLRAHGVRSEIALREPPNADLSQPIEEEAWLRIDAGRLADVQRLLPAPAAEDHDVPPLDED